MTFPSFCASWRQSSHHPLPWCLCFLTVSLWQSSIPDCIQGEQFMIECQSNCTHWVMWSSLYALNIWYPCRHIVKRVTLYQLQILQNMNRSDINIAITRHQHQLICHYPAKYAQQTITITKWNKLATSSYLHNYKRIPINKHIFDLILCTMKMLTIFPKLRT